MAGHGDAVLSHPAGSARNCIGGDGEAAAPAEAAVRDLGRDSIEGVQDMRATGTACSMGCRWHHSGTTSVLTVPDCRVAVPDSAEWQALSVGTCSDTNARASGAKEPQLSALAASYNDSTASGAHVHQLAAPTGRGSAAPFMPPSKVVTMQDISSVLDQLHAVIKESERAEPTYAASMGGPGSQDRRLTVPARGRGLGGHTKRCGLDSYRGIDITGGVVGGTLNAPHLHGEDNSQVLLHENLS